RGRKGRKWKPPEPEGPSGLRLALYAPGAVKVNPVVPLPSGCLLHDLRDPYVAASRVRSSEEYRHEHAQPQPAQGVAAEDVAKPVRAQVDPGGPSEEDDQRGSRQGKVS